MHIACDHFHGVGCANESSIWESNNDILKLGLQEKYIREFRVKIFIVIFIVSCWQELILGAYLDYLILLSYPNVWDWLILMDPTE